MELTLEWPSAIISLESLPPFSPEHLDTGLIISDIDGFSRTELADKLLDHFNVPQHQESEPFDWFSNEKPVDISFFESSPSPPFPYKTDDVKPSATQAYALSAGHYNDAAGYPQPGQQYPSTSPANVYDSIRSPLLYSPPPEHANSPPPAVPLAQPHPPATTVGHAAAGRLLYSGDVVAQPNVKHEYFDPPTQSPPASAPFNAEWLKRETLTPPDSPRDEEILKMLEGFEPEALERLMMAPTVGEAFAVSPASTLAEELSCGSPSAYSDDYSSASPYATSEGGVDDADWTSSSCVEAQQLPMGGNSNNEHNNNSDHIASRSNNNNNGPIVERASEGVAAASRRRVGKPYSKPGVEERRLRKKEQNKNAATRYRLKKKAEVEEIKLEENQVLEQNVELKKQLEEVNREVRYLKSLMREAYRKKGLIK
ncbi:hypothetical protein V9T40_001837 [Parthenolecanium corni]|uniref:BZIP domain-containing protein n=1 Tax=Parthenolecanium corni TaxID=536013 RepID=A0AAN9Y3J6_9HEMI